MENPAIQRVVSFNISDGILLHDAKQLFTELETDGVDYDEIRELLEDLLGKKTVSVRYKDVLSTTEGQDRGRTRKDVGRTGRDNNADLSAEEKRKYALKKNKKSDSIVQTPGVQFPDTLNEDRSSADIIADLARAVKRKIRERTRRTMEKKERPFRRETAKGTGRQKIGAASRAGLPR